MHHTPKVEMRKQVAEDIRSIFNASDAQHAAEELGRFVEPECDTSHSKTKPKPNGRIYRKTVALSSAVRSLPPILELVERISPLRCR
jgi:hypothetical protein